MRFLNHPKRTPIRVQTTRTKSASLIENPKLARVHQQIKHRLRKQRLTTILKKSEPPNRRGLILPRPKHFQTPHLMPLSRPIRLGDDTARRSRCRLWDSTTFLLANRITRNNESSTFGVKNPKINNRGFVPIASLSGRNCRIARPLNHDLF